MKFGSLIGFSMMIFVLLITLGYFLLVPWGVYKIVKFIKGRAKKRNGM